MEPLVESLAQEFERVRAVDGGASLVPLHYAIRAVKKRLKAGGAQSGLPELTAYVRRLTDRIERFLDDFGLDKGRQVRENLVELRDVLGAVAEEAVQAAVR